MEDVSKKVQEILWKCTFCAERSYRTVKKYDVIGAVRSRDQYDYRSSMIAGPVWSQEHPDKGRIWDKDQYDHTAGINGQYDYRTGIKRPVWSPQDRCHPGTSIITGPVWSCGRYHQGTSMVTGPVSSRDQYDHRISMIVWLSSREQYGHRTGIIQGPAWSQHQYDCRTGMITVPVCSQHRYDHRTQKSW